MAGFDLSIVQFQTEESWSLFGTPCGGSCPRIQESMFWAVIGVPLNVLPISCDESIAGSGRAGPAAVRDRAARVSYTRQKLHMPET